MEMVLSHDKNIALAKQGNRRELAKLLTIIESGERLPIKESNESWVLGVTGPPGVGKSTLIGVKLCTAIAKGFYPVPSRTRKSSPSASFPVLWCESPRERLSLCHTLFPPPHNYNNHGRSHKVKKAFI